MKKGIYFSVMAIAAIVTFAGCSIEDGVPVAGNDNVIVNVQMGTPVGTRAARVEQNDGNAYAVDVYYAEGAYAIDGTESSVSFDVANKKEGHIKVDATVGRVLETNVEYSKVATPPQTAITAIYPTNGSNRLDYTIDGSMDIMLAEGFNAGTKTDHAFLSYSSMRFNHVLAQLIVKVEGVPADLATSWGDKVKIEAVGVPTKGTIVLPTKVRVENLTGGTAYSPSTSSAEQKGSITVPTQNVTADFALTGMTAATAKSPVGYKAYSATADVYGSVNLLPTNEIILRVYGNVDTDRSTPGDQVHTKTLPINMNATFGQHPGFLSGYTYTLTIVLKESTIEIKDNDNNPYNGGGIIFEEWKDGGSNSQVF